MSFLQFLEEWIYKGCYTDNRSRTIPGGFIKLNSNNPHEQCKNTANSRGHELYAIQYNNECFTGKKTEQFNKLGPATNCKEQPTGIVGSSWSNAVYVLE